MKRAVNFLRFTMYFIVLSFFTFKNVLAADPEKKAIEKPAPLSAEDCCKTCRKDYLFCTTVTCSGWPSFSKSNCLTTCGAGLTECASRCPSNCPAPADIEIRNGSVYTINIFRHDKAPLGSLTGWYTYPLVLQESDFPIYYTSCKDLTNSDCYTNRKYGQILQKPNCYVVWFFSEFYTTLWGVGCADKNREQFSQVRPPSSLQSKIPPAVVPEKVHK